MKRTGILIALRNSRTARTITMAGGLTFLFQVFFPTASMALTSGPSTPEIQSFEPMGTSEMVDLFSGDFTYNIPLFELPGPDGGYPFNLAYHSGVGMEQEASWVGLGWNLNPGAINRTVRGLPDDFNGTGITKTQHMKPNTTFGIGGSADLEIMGGTAALGMGLQLFYNNYKGLGYTADVNIGPGLKQADATGIGLSAGLSLGSQEGIGANAGISATTQNKSRFTKFSTGIGFSEQSGISMSLSASTKKYASGPLLEGESPIASHAAGGSTISFGRPSMTPYSAMAMRTRSLSISLKSGAAGGTGLFGNWANSGFFNTTYPKNNGKPETQTAYGYNYIHNAGSDGLMDFNREKEGVVHDLSPNLAIPSTTFDYYAIQGQGVGGMFRPHRPQIGSLSDRYITSNTKGGGFGGDLSPDASHFGLNGTYTGGKSFSGPWESSDNNPLASYYTWQDPSTPTPEYESLYYKVHGEHTSFATNELDFIGGYGAVRPRLNKITGGSNKKWEPVAGELVTRNGNVLTSTDGISNARPIGRGRMPRNQAIFAPTNGKVGAAPVRIGEFDVQYYDSPTGSVVSQSGQDYTTEPQTTLNRVGRSGSSITDHQAGYSVLSADGRRYVYALPAYNTKQVEAQFSVNAPAAGAAYCGQTVPLETTTLDGQVVPNYNYGNEYLNRTETPAYAYSYLLTSVLGHDYVDVTGDGITPDDLGYWVEFEYAQVADENQPYKWRAPFKDANYSAGQKGKAEDDKASYMYGEKEVYLLRRASTRTHIAEFRVNARDDARGAASEFNSTYNSNTGPWYSTTAKSYQLDRIELFARDHYEALMTDNNSATDPVPIKSVHFDYAPATTSLCKEVENNSVAHGGKLTLSRLWFTYQQNTRGALSPYEFEYNEHATAHTSYAAGEYTIDQQDRWGNYKPGTGSVCTNLEFPYVNQFDPTVFQGKQAKENFRAAADAYASVWNLKKINLPTGGTIEVEYESDDYAYVQHMEALQMTRIAHLGPPGTANDYNATTQITPDDALLSRRVYFVLEQPIKDVGQSTSAIEAQIYSDYIKPLERGDAAPQLYFKTKINLNKSTNTSPNWEYISGYVNLETASGTFGVDETHTQTGDLDGDGSTETCFTRGYITVGKYSLEGKHVDYHPFSVNAWQYIRSMQADLLTGSASVKAPAGTTKADRAAKARSLVSVLPSALKMFRNYRKWCHNKGFGTQISLADSYVRLPSPDKVKLGGGHRVKSIKMNDGWDGMVSSESAAEYGQVYSYTITDVDGKTISSGVAQNEPHIGADENPLRWAKEYPESLPAKTDNLSFFEYPINESYYPGASVGYSKVQVMSLATHEFKTNPPANNDLLATSGVSQYTFWTAREFPTIAEETDIELEPAKFRFPTPLIGMFKSDRITATQGYSVELNDMHGKPRSVESLALDVDGNTIVEPVSRVAYIYHMKSDDYMGRMVFRLESDVEVLVNDFDPTSGTTVSGGTDYTAKTETRTVGVEYEFFTDHRHSRATSWSGGLNFNTDILGWVAPVPVPWPSVYRTVTDLRTAVTNKIVHRSGLLEKVLAYDGQSRVATENKLYDAITGRPLLTQLNNNFDAPLYKLSHPGHLEYEGMGRASDNLGFEFSAKIARVETARQFLINRTTLKYRNGSLNLSQQALFDRLVAGDEFLVTIGTTPTRATLTQKFISNTDAGPQKFWFFNTSPDFTLSTSNEGEQVHFSLYRSGKRNLLNVDAGSLVALDDPTASIYDADVVPVTQTGVPPQLEDFLTMINCDGELLRGNYNLEDELFYVDGEHQLPELSAVFDRVRVLYCSVNGCQASDCAHCDNFSGANNGYHIDVIPKGQQDFLPVCHCLARRLTDTGSQTNITSIQRIGSDMLQFNYSNYVNDSTGHSYTRFEPCTTWAWTTEPHVTSINNVLQASAVEYKNSREPQFDNCLNYDVNANYYASGHKGIWRPFKTYYYNDERHQSEITGVPSPDISTDGVYKGGGGTGADHPFYRFNWQPDKHSARPEQWIPSSTTTGYNDAGYEVESRDILGIFSAAEYGYGNALPKIVGANASRDQLFFEGFEDPSSGFIVGELGVSSGSPAVISGRAHTGTESVQVNNGTGWFPTAIKPKPGQQYTISGWVSTNSASTANNSYTHANGNNVLLKVDLYNADWSSSLNPITATDFEFVPTGEVIDGWQRIEATFTADPAAFSNYSDPADMTNLAVGFHANGVTMAFDDVRIFPTNGNVQTYVYDPVTLRLSATLDQNNYATLYSYDEEGNLFLVKKETERGIVTVQESRTYINTQ